MYYLKCNFLLTSCVCIYQIIFMYLSVYFSVHPSILQCCKAVDYVLDIETSFNFASTAAQEVEYTKNLNLSVVIKIL